jgi:hypothetical protein
MCICRNYPKLAERVLPRVSRTERNSTKNGIDRLSMDDLRNCSGERRRGKMKRMLISAAGIFLFQSSLVLGWGIRTHAMIGWYAQKQLSGTPPEFQLPQYPHSNIQPDMFHYSPIGYAHDTKFPEIMYSLSDTADEKAYSYGWMSHLAADYIGHPCYLWSPPGELVKEISVDVLFVRSDDPDEADYAKITVVEWDPYLINDASVEYVAQHGGEEISVFMANSRGFLMNLALAAERIVAENDLIYYFANLCCPREDWQGCFDQSVQKAIKWCNNMGSPSYPDIDVLEGAGSRTVLRFYLRLGVALLAGGALRVETREGGGYGIITADKGLAQKILRRVIRQGMEQKRDSSLRELSRMLHRITTPSPRWQEKMEHLLRRGE